MIRQIDYLHEFAIYRNFQWGSLPDFAKYNLIYGWNYSGKTTLSRLFQVLEKPERIASWSNTAFRLVMADGSTVTHTTLNPPPMTRVFNRDFVKLSFVEEHTAPAVFILGPENVALRRQLEVLNRRLMRVSGIESDLQGQAQRAQEEIDQLGTDKARDVGELLGDRLFKRPNLWRLVADVRADHASYILPDTDVPAKYEICRGTSTWVTLNVIQNLLPDFTVLSARITAVLGQTASNMAIERLKTNRNLESWVRAGLALHPDGAECEFCGSPIRPERMAELKGHFSDAYEALVGEVTAAIQECQNLPFDTPQLDERDFAPDLRAEFNELKEQFRNWVAWAAELRTNMVVSLTQKQTRIETPMTWETELTRAAEGAELIVQFNELIQRHNRMVGERELTRAQAKAALERHHAALLFRDNDLSGKETRCSGLNERAREAGAVRQKVSDQISALELQVRQQSIGAARLNDVLRFLLAANNIEVAAVGDGLFEFRRDGVPAANLSDGEKTAITFAYFLTSLEANGSVLADTIVFIDDPISSLDSNHIYAIYALIAERLEGRRQLLVSTHSSELLNLMKDRWFSSRQQYADNQNAHAYYVRRNLDANNRWTAQLESLPQLLRKYKSEYQFVFEQLLLFARAANPTLHEAFTSPNLLRKFLEAYLGFKKPSVSQWSAKLDLLFDTPEERREIQKFADDASHLQSLTRSLEQPDFLANAQQSVGKVIAGLKAKDFDHYQSLCVVIGATP